MPKRKTPVDGPVVAYTNRNIPAELYQRLRVAAVVRRGEFATMEHLMNVALERGLDAIESVGEAQ